jgi:hypothetical protein
LFVALFQLISNWKKFFARGLKFFESQERSRFKEFIFFLLLFFTCSFVVYSFGRVVYWSALSTFTIKVTRQELEGANATLPPSNFTDAINSYSTTKFWNSVDSEMFAADVWLVAKWVYPNLFGFLVLSVPPFLLSFPAAWKREKIWSFTKSLFY